MKRRDDVYITEYMLQASLQTAKGRRPDYAKHLIRAAVLILIVGSVVAALLIFGKF